MTPEQMELMTELKKRKQGGEQIDFSQFQNGAAPTNAPAQQGLTSDAEINALIAKATGKNAGGRLGDAISILGGGKPNDTENDYAKLYAKEAIEKQFENPLNDELKKAQIGAYNSMASAEVPDGFVRVGNKIEKDPTYRDPNAPLPPSIEARKIKATDALYDTVNNTNIKSGRIEKGLSAAPKLPQGVLGGWKMKWMNWTGSKDPSLADWQNMKSLLTDAQLQSVAKTKGAISDREMELFAQAAANDDVPNVMRQQEVLRAFQNAIFADQESDIAAYKRSFKEDPRQWGDLKIKQAPGVSSVSDIDAELAEIERQLAGG